jgi:hypothetical protein
VHRLELLGHYTLAGVQKHDRTGTPHFPLRCGKTVRIDRSENSDDFSGRTLGGL